MHAMQSMLMLALITALGAFTGCDDPDSTEPAPVAAADFTARGAQPVGHRVFEVERSDAPTLTVKAWYPAARADEAIAYPVALQSPDWQAIAPDATIAGHAAPDAALANDGPYPVVIFSHGFALNPEWYGELIEHFASHGFVVLAAEHVEHDWFEALYAAIDRPVDITATLDLAEDLTAPDGVWPGALDLEATALVGHSFGGYTALAMAGAQLNTPAIAAHCGALDPMDPKGFLCAPFAGREAEMAEHAGLDAVPDTLWPSVRDDRIRAIVPISGDAWFFGEAGLANVDVPVMAMGGTEDFGAPWDWSSLPAFEHTQGAQRVLVGFEGGGHFLPVNVCADLPWIERIAEIYDFACFDSAWDRRAALDTIKHLSTSFLRTVLMDDASAREALTEEVTTDGMIVERTF